MFSCVRNIIFEKLLKLLNLSSNYSQKMSEMFFIGTQCIALYRKPIAKLRSVTCHMGSHIVICHPTQMNAPRLSSLLTYLLLIYSFIDAFFPFQMTAS